VVVVKLHLLGVRGSTAAPGAAFVRYGGHTSCIAVLHEDASVPTLVLDAGTGLRSLTEHLDGRAYEGAVLLSHLHWDHMQGLPFFTGGDRDDARVDLYLPAQGGASGRDLLAQAMSPPAFPLAPEGLRGAWRFHSWDGGARDIETFAVRAVDVAHKAGRTFAHRVERDGVSMAYLPDHAPAAGVSSALLELLSGVDLLVHDAQFLDGERPAALDYGHATVQEAVALAVECGAGALLLFHHSPNRTDDALDEIGTWAADLAPSLRVLLAREGDVLDVVRHRADPRATPSSSRPAALPASS
jgi:ribonuclease BN (tRNA processing enzyme)